jgi:hypothetical protein
LSLRVIAGDGDGVSAQYTAEKKYKIFHVAQRSS